MTQPHDHCVGQATTPTSRENHNDQHRMPMILEVQPTQKLAAAKRHQRLLDKDERAD
jgi:hypothetical protein